MHRFFQILCLFFYYSFAYCIQPYFPPQVVFTTDYDRVLIAIDEINQRAFMSFDSLMDLENAYVFKHIPYAPSDSPQAKNYVQLLADRTELSCQYETFWEYGGMRYNVFPSHWGNATSFQIGNFMNFQYKMIHSTSSSDTEDYWFADESCLLSSGQSVPCEEIYFKKNTDIPLRYTEVYRGKWGMEQITLEYDVKSVGKPDEKYFDVSPKNWSVACRDAVLGLTIYPEVIKLAVEHRYIVQIWLSTPPHRVNGNDTVTMQWNVTYGCTDCLTWTPKEFVFNINNFQERQNVTLTRVKDGQNTVLEASLHGGGFDIFSPVHYSILIQ